MRSARPRPWAGSKTSPSLRRIGWVAVTGTPGTGKTRATQRLPAGLGAVEVADLALQLRAGRRRAPASVEVDLRLLRRRFRLYQRSHPHGVVVGHLAHLLPVSYVIVLRCHPRELARRLRAKGRSSKDRQANVLSETLDIVLVEALRTGAPVREVDTTGRSPDAVGRILTNLVRRRPPAKFGRVNWMADPRVTAELLRGRLWTP
jgi:adenylate kinase